jgi:hypothetical protein
VRAAAVQLPRRRWAGRGHVPFTGRAGSRVGATGTVEWLLGVVARLLRRWWLIGRSSGCVTCCWRWRAQVASAAAAAGGGWQLQGVVGSCRGWCERAEVARCDLVSVVFSLGPAINATTLCLHTISHCQGPSCIACPLLFVQSTPDRAAAAGVWLRRQHREHACSQHLMACS